MRSCEGGIDGVEAEEGALLQQWMEGLATLEGDHEANNLQLYTITGTAIRA